MAACEARQDCYAVATQSNICEGDYRVVVSDTGDPGATFHANWRTYNLWSWTLDRDCVDKKLATTTADPDATAAPDPLISLTARLEELEKSKDLVGLVKAVESLQGLVAAETAARTKLEIKLADAAEERLELFEQIRRADGTIAAISAALTAAIEDAPNPVLDKDSANVAPLAQSVVTADGADLSIEAPGAVLVNTNECPAGIDVCKLATAVQAIREALAGLS